MWHPGWETVHTGDTYGNPVTSKIGLVTLRKRTMVGTRTWPGTKVGDATEPPTETYELESLNDLIRVLGLKRSELIKATGGFS